jgi:SAM-dependent methyltransferase
MPSLLRSWSYSSQPPTIQHMPTLADSLRNLKYRFPKTYWRARSAISLMQWAAGRLAGSRERRAYGEEFYAAHQEGDWMGLARAILSFAPARRIVDIGCGDGNLLVGLAAVDPAIQLLGLEGSPHAVARARSRNLDVRACDLSRRGAGTGEIESFGPELAISLEVAEHLPPWRASGFVKLLSHAPRVVFSAAAPLQGGTLHLNEQPPEYWIRRFRRYGMRLSPVDGEFRATVAALEIAPWYKNNVHLFERAITGGA